MQVTSHPKTGWNGDQMMNEPFESNGKITTDKNEARSHPVCFSLT